MKRAHTFTSTIAPELIAWVDKHARKERRTRRSVLEDAIVHYRKAIAQENLRQGLAKAARDADMVELAEWGMDEYTRTLSRF